MLINVDIVENLGVDTINWCLKTLFIYLLFRLTRSNLIHDFLMHYR